MSVAADCEIPTSTAFGAVRRALESDRDYAQGWYDNLACAAMDEGVDSATANKIASRFMKNCFGVQTAQH